MQWVGPKFGHFLAEPYFPDVGERGGAWEAWTGEPQVACWEAQGVWMQHASCAGSPLGDVVL